MADEARSQADAAWEQACNVLWEEILRQEHYNAMLDLCTFWQQHFINQLSQMYAEANVKLARNAGLSLHEATWPMYQVLACDSLSTIHETVRKALLLEVQLLCLRMRGGNAFYPATLEEAKSALLRAVEKSAQETLTLEAEERQVTAQQATLLDEHVSLEARLRALQLAADVSGDPDAELVSVRRVPVADVSSDVSSVDIGD